MRDDPSASWSEHRLHRLIFEHSSDAIAVIDDDGRLLAANRAARALPDVDVERLFLWTPQRDPDLTSLRAQLRVGGRGAVELRLRNADGGTRLLSLEGRAHGPTYVIVLRDVTERRRMEDELRHLRQFEDVGHLTAAAVHDFNNALTAIVCATSVLEGDVVGQERASAMALDIRVAAERAAGLVRRVLSLQRRQPSKPEHVDLGEAVAETRSLLELVLGPRIELSIQGEAELGDTLVERDQLDHVLLNLAANARDAMPAGGKLSIVTANVPLDDMGVAAAHCGPGSSYVSLSFADTGEGMPPEVRERVFERFYTTRPTGNTMGLGLATAYRFVKRSGGCIAVRSAPGQGTTVVVYLPRVTPVAQSSPVPTGVGEPGPRGRETILVVDGDDPVRGALRAVLRENGYRVIDAPTGDLAMRQAEIAITSIDLVLADIGAPGVRGREIVEQLRAAGQSPRLLWMSGDTDRSIAEQRVNREPLLRKAFTPAQLVQRIREVLDGPDEEAAAQA